MSVSLDYKSLKGWAYLYLVNACVPSPSTTVVTWRHSVNSCWTDRLMEVFQRWWILRQCFLMEVGFPETLSLKRLQILFLLPTFVFWELVTRGAVLPWDWLARPLLGGGDGAAGRVLREWEGSLVE